MFILRKGTIENYYQFSDSATASDKPRVAAKKLNKSFISQKDS
jgi:hypothetical protein